MVKFNKKLYSSKVQRWENDYINYKVLKQILNEIYIKIRITAHQNESKERSLNKSKKRKPRYINKTHRQLIKKFKDTLNTEIEKIYYKYMSIERELFIKLNQLLHDMESINNINLISILSECERIYLLTLDTRLFSDYVFINLEGIRKIIKKFDKKLIKYNDNKSLMLDYIMNLSEKKDNNLLNNLNYIIECKIIDELYILIQFILLLLNKRLKTLHDTLYMNKNIQKNKVNNNQIDMEKMNYAEHDVNIMNDVNQKVKKYTQEINNQLSLIDINGKYRYEYLNENILFGFEITNKNKFDIEFDYLNVKENESSIMIIKKFIPLSGYSEYIKNHVSRLNDINLKNINFLIYSRKFIEIFKYMNYGVMYKTIEKLDKEYKSFMGLGICLIELGNMISYFVIKGMSKEKMAKMYKLGLVASFVDIMVCNLFSVGIGVYKINSVNKNILLLMVSRFLIGLATSHIIVKRYIVDYVPNSLLHYFIKNFDISVIRGRIIGLILSSLIPLVNFKSELSNYLFFIVIIFSFIFYLLIKSITTFNNPSVQKFSVYKKKQSQSFLYNNLNSASKSNRLGEELNEYNEEYQNEDEEIDKQINDIEEEEQEENDNEIEFTDSNQIISNQLNNNEELNRENAAKATEANDKLNDINILNQFTDNNLIPNNVKKIINTQNKKRVYQNIILLFIICCCQFINNSLLILLLVGDLHGNDLFIRKIINMILAYLLYKRIEKFFNRMNTNKFLKQFIYSEIIIFIMDIMLLLLDLLHIEIYSLGCWFIFMLNLIMMKKIKKFISVNYQNDFKVQKFNTTHFITVCQFVACMLGNMFPFVLNKVFKIKILRLVHIPILSMHFILFVVDLILMLLCAYLYNKKINFVAMKIYSRIIKRNLYQ